MYKKSVQGWLKHLDFMILDVSVVGRGKLIEGTEVKGKCGKVMDIIYKIGSHADVAY